MIDFELEPPWSNGSRCTTWSPSNDASDLARVRRTEHEDPDQFFQTMWQAQSLAESHRAAI